MAPVLLLPNVDDHLLGLGDVQVMVPAKQPGQQYIHLLQIGLLPAVADQDYHLCVVCELDNDAGGMSGFAVMSVEGVDQRTQPGVGGRPQVVVCWSQSSGAKIRVRSSGPGLWAWRAECRAVVNKQLDWTFQGPGLMDLLQQAGTTE